MQHKNLPTVSIKAGRPANQSSDGRAISLHKPIQRAITVQAGNHYSPSQMTPKKKCMFNLNNKPKRRNATETQKSVERLMNFSGVLTAERKCGRHGAL